MLSFQTRTADENHFSRNGTGVTNFDPEDTPIYEEAVRRHGHPELWIEKTPYSSGGLRGDGSLHCNKYKDLSSFWETFEAVALAMGGTKIDKYLKTSRA